MAITPQAIAKNLGALQKTLGSAQVQWAIGGTLFLDLGGPEMRREHDGAIACVGERLHFFRKSMGGGAHEAFELNNIRAIELVTARFADQDVDLVMLDRSDGNPSWAIATESEQRQFFLEQLSGQ